MVTLFFINTVGANSADKIPSYGKDIRDNIRLEIDRIYSFRPNKDIWMKTYLIIILDMILRVN